MNKLDKDYLDLVKDIIDNGTVSGDRTGTGTKKIFGRQIRHNMKDGFPLLTSKKMFTKGIIYELIWFLNGDTNIKYLIDNDVHIWDGDAYKNYCKYTSGNTDEYNKWMRTNEDGSLSMYTLEEFVDKIKTDIEFAEKWGDLGPIYGKQWRKWSGTSKVPIGFDKGIPIDFKEVNHDDQILLLINQLKNNPDSRRLMVSAWNVAEVEDAVLPPCHYGFQVFTRELSLEERKTLYFESDKYYHPHYDDDTVSDTYSINDGDLFWEELMNEKEINVPKRAISLMWNQRSCDFLLGIPFNLASYGFLLEMIAQVTNMVPEELIGNLGDCHVYLNQIEFFDQQLNNQIYDLPKLLFNNKVKDIFDFKFEDFKIENYISSGIVKYPLSN